MTLTARRYYLVGASWWVGIALSRENYERVVLLKEPKE